MGGGSHDPPLGVISRHSVGDAPTTSKFLDFSQLHPYFYLVKKNKFLKKMVKNIFSYKYGHFLFQICNQYALRKFLRCITGQKLAMLKIRSTSITFFPATSRLLLNRLYNSGG